MVHKLLVYDCNPRYWGFSSVVELLPSKCKALGSILSWFVGGGEKLNNCFTQYLELEKSGVKGAFHSCKPQGNSPAKGNSPAEGLRKLQLASVLLVRLARQEVSLILLFPISGWLFLSGWKSGISSLLRATDGCPTCFI